MDFQSFIQIFMVQSMKPWEHDYYVVNFQNGTTSQEFADYTFSKAKSPEGLTITGLWFELRGNTVYFILPKGSVLDNDYSDQLTVVTGVPTQNEV
jgi:hypothetical protein